MGKERIMQKTLGNNFLSRPIGMRYLAFGLLSLIMGCVGEPDETLYSASSKAQGMSFDLAVTEIKRELNKSYISVPGFHNRTAAGSRWLMCVYNELAVNRRFTHWTVAYPPEGSDILVVGLTNSPNLSSKELLGQDYSAERTLGAELDPVDKWSYLCRFIMRR